MPPGAGEPLHPGAVLAVLALAVCAAEWLGRRRGFRALGASLLVILLGAVFVNVGLLPPYAEGAPLYDVLLSDVALLGVFWLLLQVNLRAVLRAGPSMLLLFLLGAAGSLCGVLIAMHLLDGAGRFGAEARALGGMFVGTYIGGSLNFNAIAAAEGVAKDGALFLGANAVDASLSTVWMAVTLVAPRLLGGRRARPPVASFPGAESPRVAAPEDAPVSLLELSFVLALGLAALELSSWIAAWIEPIARVPGLLVLSTLALLLAQVPGMSRLRAARGLGMLAVYFFLATIGALCDLQEVRALGALALPLVLLVLITFVVHGAVVFGAARLLRLDPVVAAVASQANIGGGSTALALARVLGRPELELPAVLVGSLGTGLGTYAGYLAIALLG